MAADAETLNRLLSLSSLIGTRFVAMHPHQAQTPTDPHSCSHLYTTQTTITLAHTSELNHTTSTRTPTGRIITPIPLHTLCRRQQKSPKKEINKQTNKREANTTNQPTNHIGQHQHPPPVSAYLGLTICGGLATVGGVTLMLIVGGVSSPPLTSSSSSLRCPAAACDL